MPDADLHSGADDLALIRDAAQEAGRIAMRYFRQTPEVWMKPGDSPVSEADFAVDRFLRETLLAARPDYGWLSEETADDPARLAARRTFIVDPIDGTRAFIDGRDVWCVSIAVVEHGATIAGVLDCAARNEVFTATTGSGALLNDAPIRVASGREPPIVAGPKALLTAFADRGARFTVQNYVPSLAYRIAMLACGRIDGTFVKARSHDWDLAAADLILAEAGGSVWDAAGAPLRYGEADPVKGLLVAGSGPLLRRMTDLIATLET